jgi:hypothetical protein
VLPASVVIKGSRSRAGCAGTLPREKQLRSGRNITGFEPKAFTCHRLVRTLVSGC